MDTASTLTRATATLLAALAIQPGTTPPEPIEVAATKATQVVEIVVDAQAGWAIERFDLAGLEFPEVSVLFHETKDACQDNVGLYTGDTIHVCIRADGTYRDKVLLHELGHAWAARNLDDAQRQTFLELRGLGAWNDSGTDWGERGFEQAAEILAWGLLEIPTTPAQISTNDCESLTEAYEILVGAGVPRQQVCG
ncbi:MAG: hypothetical protein OEX97_02020 [Acidimicrobiia bacterium]|nr:hypothetical protein [Acidimicrobiia bacterium]